MKDWFLGKIHPRALESSTKEVKTFVDGLKAMSDEDIGTIIAVATLIRINFETHGVRRQAHFLELPGQPVNG